MQLLKKDSLKFINGYLLDENDCVLNSPSLVDQVNKLNDLIEFNKFLEENRTYIEMRETKLVYVPKKRATKALVEKPLTPVKDLTIRHSEKLFAELEQEKAINSINQTAEEELGKLLEFIQSKTFLMAEMPVSRKFNLDVLSITKDDLISELKKAALLQPLADKVSIES